MKKLNSKWCMFLIGILMVLSLDQADLWAKTDSEIRDSIRTMLLDRHPSDTPEWWRNLGSQAPQVIMKMYEQSDRVDHRMKLLQGLGAFDHPQNTEFLKKQVQDSETDDVLRNTAIRSIAASQGSKETDFIAHYLKDSDPQIRLAAAESLQKIGDDKSRSVLSKYRKDEKESWIISRLEGEYPNPTEPQKVTGSSKTEQSRKSELEGTWVGYWLVPNSNPPKGMKSESALFVVQSDATQDLKGTLTVKKKGIMKKFIISKLLLKQNRLSGSFADSSDEVEGDILHQVGAKMIHLKVPKLGGILVARKNP